MGMMDTPRKPLLAPLAALLVAAAPSVFSEPGSFSGAEHLTDSHNHAQGYDGNARMASIVGAPPAVLGVRFSERTPTPPAAVPEKGFRPAAVPDSDKPLTADELDALVQMFPRQRADEASGFAAAAAMVKNAVLDHQDREFTKKMLAKLQESETGRRVLRELNYEARLRGVKITIQPKEYEGTSIVKQNGMESLWGIRGTAHYNGWQYNYNEGFMRMEDKKKALEVAASNMGHELNHLVWKLKSDRLLPEYKAVLQRDLGNEKAARLIGYLVSTEINDGRPSDYTQETKGLAADPDRYWESMKLWHPGYALSLDHVERKDPIAAYTKRLTALVRKKERYVQQRDLWQPAREKEVAHFEGPEHNLKEKLSEIRSYLNGSKKRYPVNIKQMDDAIRYVKNMKEYLEQGKSDPKRNPKAAELLSATVRSATDPAYLKFEAQMHKDQKDLVATVKKQGLPSVKPGGDAGKITWQQFYAMVEKDRNENPDHWKESDGK
jgi:hypothetical protein